MGFVDVPVSPLKYRIAARRLVGYALSLVSVVVVAVRASRPARLVSVKWAVEEPLAVAVTSYVPMTLLANGTALARPAPSTFATGVRKSAEAPEADGAPAKVTSPPSTGSPNGLETRTVSGASNPRRSGLDWLSPPLTVMVNP